MDIFLSQEFMRHFDVKLEGNFDCIILKMLWRSMHVADPKIQRIPKITIKFSALQNKEHESSQGIIFLR